MQTPIGASRATSIELSVKEELVFIIYRIGIMRFTRTRVTYNGTAIKVGYVTRRSYPANCPVCWQGIVPVARRVWRGTCQVECGWLSDRVTIMQGYKCL